MTSKANGDVPRPEEPRLSRRTVIATAGLAIGAAAFASRGLGSTDLGAGGVPSLPANPAEALRRLIRGNRRYRRGQLELRDYSRVGDRVAEDQEPFAAILTCSDSRISPTLVFDIGRGNLFVSRIAGNALDTGTLGSTEYAVAVLGVKLIMVLGHSDCGAVKSAIGVANGTASYPSDKYGAIGAVVDDVVPAISALPPGERTLERSIEANAVAQAEALAATDPVIKPGVTAGDLLVVAAVYDIATGRVRVL